MPELSYGRAPVRLVLIASKQARLYSSSAFQVAIVLRMGEPAAAALVDTLTREVRYACHVL